MKSFFLTIALFSIVAVLPVSVFAQSSDDTDGDGVKNSDDACPTLKGSKAGKGCPGGESDKSTPATAPSPTPTPTPKPIAANPAVKSGSFADCKNILSDGCRNYFMSSTIDGIKGELGVSGPVYDRLISLQIYRKGEEIELWVEPSSGRILSVNIHRLLKGLNPGKGVKWGEKPGKVEKKIGTAKWGGSGSSTKLYYPNLELKFSVDSLQSIRLEQPANESERTAKAIRAREDDPIMREKWRAEETYANSPAGIQNAFDSMHSQVENYANQANKQVEDFNKNQYIYESLGKRKEKEDEIYIIRKKGIDLITKFMTDYAGKLPQAMIDHLNEDLAKLRSDKGH